MRRFHSLKNGAVAGVALAMMVAAQAGAAGSGFHGGPAGGPAGVAPAPAIVSGPVGARAFNGQNTGVGAYGPRSIGVGAYGEGARFDEGHGFRGFPDGRGAGFRRHHRGGAVAITSGYYGESVDVGYYGGGGAYYEADSARYRSDPIFNYYLPYTDVNYATPALFYPIPGPAYPPAVIVERPRPRIIVLAHRRKIAHRSCHCHIVR